MLVDESVKGLWFLDDPYIQWHTKPTHDGNGVYLHNSMKTKCSNCMQQKLSISANKY